MKKLGFRVKAAIGKVTEAIVGEHVHSVLVDSRNGLLAVDPEDQGVGRRLRADGEYNFGEVDRIAELAGEDGRVLVVGAHIGALAIPVAQRCREVVAIEANPVTFELLQLNVHINRVENLSIHSIAASDEPGEISFLLSRANSGGSKRVPVMKDYAYYYDDPEEIRVAAVRLDDHLDDLEFDVVVADIEGSEYFALGGMPQILEHAHTLIVEFLPHHLEKVADVTVEAFLGRIEPHFSRLHVPSTGRRAAGRAEMLEVLEEMYAAGLGDDGLVFRTGEGG